MAPPPPLELAVPRRPRRPWCRSHQLCIGDTWSSAHRLLRHASEKATSGLLLCRAKDRIILDHAPRDLKKPIRVVGWKTTLVESPPEDLKSSLPLL